MQVAPLHWNRDKCTTSIDPNINGSKRKRGESGGAVRVARTVRGKRFGSRTLSARTSHSNRLNCALNGESTRLERKKNRVEIIRLNEMMTESTEWNEWAVLDEHHSSSPDHFHPYRQLLIREHRSLSFLPNGK